MKIENYIRAIIQKIIQKMTPLQLGLIFGIWVFIYFWHGMNNYPHGFSSWYDLFENGRQTSAFVTGLKPEEHNACYFEYTVGAKRYTGGDVACHVGIGDEIPITYLPADPSFSTYSAPILHLLDFVVVPVLSILTLYYVAKSFGRYKRNLEKKSKEPSKGSE